MFDRVSDDLVVSLKSHARDGIGVCGKVMMYACEKEGGRESGEREMREMRESEREKGREREREMEEEREKERETSIYTSPHTQIVLYLLNHHYLHVLFPPNFPILPNKTDISAINM